MADDKLSESQIVRFKRIAQLWEWIKANVVPTAIIAGVSGIAGGLAGHFEAYIGFGYRLASLEDAQKDTKKELSDTLGAGSQMQQDIVRLQEQVKLLRRDVDRIYGNVDLDLNEKMRADELKREQQRKGRKP